MTNISALISEAKLALAHAEVDLADGAARLKNIVMSFIAHHEAEQEPAPVAPEPAPAAPEPALVAAKGKGKVSTAEVADTAVVAAEVEPQPE